MAGTVLFRTPVCAVTQSKRELAAPAVHCVRIWPLCYWPGSARVYTNSTGDQSEGVNRLLLAGVHGDCKIYRVCCWVGSMVSSVLLIE